MLLGATATDSKTSFVQWVDDMVMSVATDHCKVYLLSGARDHGNFVAKFSKPKTWIADILCNNYSCGGFVNDDRRGTWAN